MTEIGSSSITFTLDQVKEIRFFLNLNHGSTARTMKCLAHYWKDSEMIDLALLIEKIHADKTFETNFIP